MKITVITGSPRKNGNTFAMVEWDIVGEELVPGVFGECDIDKTDGCTFLG